MRKTIILFLVFGLTYKAVWVGRHSDTVIRQDVPIVNPRFASLLYEAFQENSTKAGLVRDGFSSNTNLNATAHWFALAGAIECIEVKGKAEDGSSDSGQGSYAYAECKLLAGRWKEGPNHSYYIRDEDFPGKPQELWNLLSDQKKRDAASGVFHMAPLAIGPERLSVQSNLLTCDRALSEESGRQKIERCRIINAAISQDAA